MIDRTTVHLPLIVAALLVLLPGASPAAPAHPMDPLTADEMLGAANLLLQRGAAQPGAVFQSIELREPAKQEVLNARLGAATASRMATVLYRQNKRSFRTIVNLSAGTFTPPALIPRSDGQLGLTITEVSDFSFAFQDPAFLAALALRGIRSAEQLQNVFVTPLTPGSFGLPEEAQIPAFSSGPADVALYTSRASELGGVLATNRFVFPLLSLRGKFSHAVMTVTLSQ